MSVVDFRAIPAVEAMKTKHHTIGQSVQGLWTQYLYGDAWRLVEIVIGTWVVLRGLTILFAGGMEADYYRAFPSSDQHVIWGLLAVLIGCGRIAGTVINGKWQRSPRLRWSAGVCGIAYQGIHFLLFAQLGYVVIAIGYLFWTVLESAGVIRSSIDILRKRDAQCRNG